MVLLSGPAGCGKSNIAKDVISILSADYFAFSFRAEEFAQPHFDATLQGNQIPVNAATLGAILAGQDRKLLLIESVERLLEKSTRDAFSDLLTLAVKDKTLQIILTSRDYSTDLVRACFLDAANIEHSVVTVPQLNDDELEEVEVAHPELNFPLSNPALRRILSNPYVIEKALSISWSADRPLPESEREFRALFWKQIIRAEHHLAGGMPRRREEVFVQIALRRARELTVYISCNDLDPAVVDALRHDSLVVSSEQSAVLVAPAHDVLEDWAILHWIEEQNVTHYGSLSELSATIGTHPALRRAYRKWVAELLEREPSAADRIFQAAVIEVGIPPQFRDDTLVSILKAPSAAEFLERHITELLANNKNILMRVIHLLRVACVTMPTWLPKSMGHGSLFNVPDGPAWGRVLQLVADRLAEFEQGDYLHLLGLIEDWSRSVNWQMPYPDGATAVAAIAYWLLQNFDNYRSEDQRKRTLHVIAKIPIADSEQFEVLLQGSANGNQRDRIVEDFRDFVLAGFDGTPAARDLPDLVISTARDYLLCSEADLLGDRQYGGSLMLETLFGIKEGLNSDYFPASAYHGPFLPLLRYHPTKGKDFIIAVLNHSAEWYAHPRVSENIEPPFEIELIFTDGISRRQWCNARLWNLYRGSSVGPYVLQCLLVVLERWLLEFAERHPRELDAALTDILRRSNSAALTAVVASVATAFPHASGETLLVLLRSPICIRLDRQRMATETNLSSSLLTSMLELRAENKIYMAERKEANALPHRRSDLEAAIANLQLGPFATRVHEILDQHRAALPPVSEQDDEDRAWRLSIHRMDLRRYTVTGEVDEDATAMEGVTSHEQARHYIRLAPMELEPDVREMAEESAAQLEALNTSLNLLMWGLNVFNNEDTTTYDPMQWRQRLMQARNVPAASSIVVGLDIAAYGPGFIAAVCARDHWEEMSDDEREWAVDLICDEVMLDADTWNNFAREQRHEMSADRPCSLVISQLIGRSLSKVHQTRVRETFPMALTHAIDEVRQYAVWGVARYVSSTNRDLALRCVNALATEATRIEQAWDWEEQPYLEPEKLDAIEAEAALAIRQHFWTSGFIPDNSYEALDIRERFGARANVLILAILSKMPTEPVAIAEFGRMAETLVALWDIKSERSHDQSRGRSERNYWNEMAASMRLQEFVMRTSSDMTAAILMPILDAVDRHPREIYGFIQGLVGIEDREPNTPQFWFVWLLFADRIRRANWLAQLDQEYPIGNEMITAIFLGLSWKEEVHHWRSLEGYAFHVHDLFNVLPPSSTVMDNYVRFLYDIGEQLLPEAFVHIANRLHVGDHQKMLRKTNTVFLLEVLLQRHVYRRPLELKRERRLRDAVLFLLDLLVEQGSSAAFRMRDDFVTPISR
ncbi:MAG: ATP-binding protein [Methanothrix sp.]|nr:ATP-binding protein [Methanothrix sp.]